MLSDVNFDIVYTSGKNEPIKFFFESLVESVSFDLGLGYFSSSAIHALSPGFACFIAQGGKMRVIINDELSLIDKEAIEKGQKHIYTEVENSLLTNIKELLKKLSKHDRHFFNCLSYLISQEKIEFKATIPRGSNGGVAHPKYGIFRDSDGNTVAFNGSANFSKNALFYNFESISCYRSWLGEGIELKRIQYFEDLFNDTWEGNNLSLRTIPISKVKSYVNETFPIINIAQLLNDENDLFNDLFKLKKINIEKYMQQKIQEIESIPSFPNGWSARSYQVEAYNNWVKNSFQGIFAMATGTGKTITSLNCVLEEYFKTKSYHILILVPYLALVDQWILEVKKFNYQGIIEVSGRSNWREKLTQIKNNFSFGIKQNFVIISTYDSFSNRDFQILLSKLQEDIIIIADEAHNIGAPNVKKVFNNIKFKKRIALSATPKRCYDEDGTKTIEQFFNDAPPYCYNFTMERAINEDCLTHYLYYPRIVYLSDKELVRYTILTQKLLKYFDGKSLKSCPEVEKLLLIRKQIIHKAVNKLDVFRSIIGEIKKSRELTYCFVYAPEGFEGGSEVDKRIIQKMCEVLHDASPETTFNTFLGGDSNKSDSLRSFSEGSTNVLLAMKCLDEGIDIPRAEIGIFASSTGNPRQFIQRRGRLLRKHADKNYSRIYDMVVVPRYGNNLENNAIFKIERSLVRNELTRVAYFASLADNYSEAKLYLEEICTYYKLSIDVLIKELA